jgi:outer membrane cobalamin receptor
LKQDSELLFVGDAGVTEPSRPSRRYGVEWINYWRPLKWLLIDAEIALTNARFTDDDPAGAYIPGAVSQVGELGFTVDNSGRWYGSLQTRYLGTRPLIEDNSVRSNPLTVTNLRVGYRVSDKVRVHLDVLNLFDSDGHDIDYYYGSCMRSEVGVDPHCPAGGGGEGVNDIHFHPIEPRQLRLTVSAQF